MVEGGSFDTFNQTASLSRLEEQFRLRVQRRAFPRGQHAGHAARSCCRRDVPRSTISTTTDTASTKLGVDISESFRLNYVGRYTESELRFTGDEFLPPTFRGVPRAVQSEQDVKQFFTRGEAVWTGFDGRFTNYFGVNYTDHFSANQATPIGATDDQRRAAAPRWTGAALRC